MSRSTYDVKESYTGNGSLSAYSFDFKIEDESQLLIIEADAAGVETQRVRGTDNVYLSSVTFDAVNGGGTVNLAANLTSGYTLLILLANDEPTQEYEFRNKNSFTLKRFEGALDFLAGAIQRLAYRGAQALRIHDLDDPSTFNPMFPPGAADSANKILQVNADGDGFEFGLTTGQLTTLEGDASDSADAAAASALAAAGSATTAASEASDSSDSADLSEEWATKITGDVDGSEFSSKAYALGGTGITATASKGAAKEWAIKTDAAVDTSEYSAKEYAQGIQTRGLAGGGSAKDWASYVDGSNTVDDTEYSAKYYAQQASNIAGTEVVATETISDTGNIAHSGALKQYRRVTGNAGAVTTATTPFGTNPANFTDGMEIILMGMNDANYVTIPVTDIQYGVQSPAGQVSLQQGWSVTYIYDATAERFYEKCRNS